MAFDQATRNRLARFVSETRALLTEEFTRQLQLEYGLDPSSGARVELDKLAQLDDARRATAAVLRETLDHYLAATASKGQKATQEALDRIVREQAFTVLNRLCALRMAEARGLIIESVAQGYQSRGFQLYGRLAGTALGETGDAYRVYLFSLFDELAVDLPVLFDRFAPEGRLFPREAALLALLDLLNHPDLAELWAADETIGWVYQYFNSQEERRQMRAESQAPRNSRELAVRNQFFTPRYVVEFLADNTLGRTWYEMTQGQTGLVDSCRYLVRRPNEVFLQPGEQAPAQDEPAEGLSQEELLRQPVYIPHRPLKDPRSIRLLDPACGSMHFGLYAFDLFERIYEEAWALEAERGPGALERAPLDAPLLEAYPDKDAFLREVPRLIVERNIHGVDIDPRAVQIAGLALWLRAQRSWRERGVKAQERPAIRRSNVVCAEPMPGDPALLDEFVARELSAAPEDKVVAQMLRRVFKAMELAGEAGSLLKIEEEIVAIVAEGKKAWRQGPRYDQASLFGDEPRPRQGELDIDATGVTDEGFWQRAEGRIYAALEEYSGFAEGSGAYRRRLFVDDAKQGFAFIELCRKRYDVVLMNPPFGSASTKTKSYFERQYPDWNNNLLCCFLQRGMSLCFNERLGAIFDKTVWVKLTYENFRRSVLLKNGFINCATDLGWEVLDANVEVTTSVIDCWLPKGNTTGYFFDMRSVDPIEKGDILLHSVQSCQMPILERCYLLSQSQVDHMPNAVIAYDLLPFAKRLFSNQITFMERGFQSYTGAQIRSEQHFLLFWERPQDEPLGPKENYSHLYNGGEYTRFYMPPRDIVLFGEQGCRVNQDDTSYTWRLRLNSTGSHYYKSGLGFGVRGEYLDAHILRRDHVFTVEGQLMPIGHESSTYILLALMNSPIYQLLINYFCGQHKYSGYINLLPLIDIPEPKKDDITEIVSDTLALLERCATFDMTTLVFRHNWLASLVSKHNVQDAIVLILESANTLRDSVRNHYKSINTIIETCCGTLSSEEIHEIRIIEDKILDIGLPFEKLSAVSLVSDFIDYLVGVAYGLWDIRSSVISNLSFGLTKCLDKLPSHPPGMLQNPTHYPLHISQSGIFVDDEGNIEDLLGRVREIIQVTWNERAEMIEHEVCEILNVRHMRDYFARPAGFFADHLVRYSKSRRQAPIYWPLSTPSGSYTIWLYYHRLSDQTLYSCVNDFVEPKLKVVSDQLAVLSQKAGRSAREEKELERLDALRKELGDLRAELLRIAAFWKPNLNDGVQITAAPLWRLFQYKPWQKRLKETWEQMEKGEYDWSHLAYSLWPERVGKKYKEAKPSTLQRVVQDQMADKE